MIADRPGSDTIVVGANAAIGMPVQSILREGASPVTGIPIRLLHTRMVALP